ncbi:MAG: M48 family metallopeptidase [Chitinophagaceae bacterium]
MIKRFTLLFLSGAILLSCAKNAITGRRQLKLLPESEVQSMALTEYQTFLTQNKVVASNANKDAEMVKRVGQRISSVVEKYYAEKGKSSDLEGYKWEYNLVDSKEVNAWCMPGGKIVVYTGLLPVTQNEAALAVVMGHEVSHAIFQHGNSRMSQGLVQQLGGVALSVALSSKPSETQQLFQTAYGVGSQVAVMLPFSRADESEADHYGIIWAAMAGYNPQEAIPLWQRMASAGGQKPPEFLSTHPSDERRIADLQAHMPEALKYYKPVGK